MQPVIHVVVGYLNRVTYKLEVGLFEEQVALMVIALSPNSDIGRKYHITPVPPNHAGSLIFLLPARRIRGQCSVWLRISTEPLLISQPSKSPLPIMVEVNDGCALLQQHVEIPINQIVPILVALLELVAQLIVPHFLHVQGYFHRPTLDHFAHVVPVLEFQQFKRDEMLERSRDLLLVVNEVQQVLPQIMQISSISLSMFGSEVLNHGVSVEIEKKLNPLGYGQLTFMQNMQKQQSSAQQLFVCLVEIYLDCGFLGWRVLVEVAEGLENVADIGSTRDQHAQRTVWMTREGVVLEEMSCRSKAPMLQVTYLTDELHFQINLKQKQVIGLNRPKERKMMRRVKDYHNNQSKVDHLFSFAVLSLCRWISICLNYNKMQIESRINTIEQDIYQQLNQPVLQLQQPKKETPLVHTMRAVFIIIDITKSMGMKDFKPSRLAAAVMAVRQFLQIFKRSTPIAMAGLGLSFQDTCKIVTDMTFDMSEIESQLEQIKILDDPGCFSFQSSIFQAIVSLDKLKTSFHREVLVLQSSPMTKDEHNLFQTVEILEKSDVKLNVISMCGWTEAIKKSVQKLKGKYLTVTTTQDCLLNIKKFATPPEFNSRAVKMELVKMGLVRKEQLKTQKRCICHFQPHKTVYVCTTCASTICREPPLECPICGIMLVMPTDLYNHTIQ